MAQKRISKQSRQMVTLNISMRSVSRCHASSLSTQLGRRGKSRFQVVFVFICEHMKFHNGGKIGDKLSNISLKSVKLKKDESSKTLTTCPCAGLAWQVTNGAVPCKPLHLAPAIYRSTKHTCIVAGSLIPTD